MFGSMVSLGVWALILGTGLEDLEAGILRMVFLDLMRVIREYVVRASGLGCIFL